MNLRSCSSPLWFTSILHWNGAKEGNLSVWGSTNLSPREEVKEGGCCDGGCYLLQQRSAMSFSAERLHTSQRQSSHTSQEGLDEEALLHSTTRQQKGEETAMRGGENGTRSSALLFSWMNWTCRDLHGVQSIIISCLVCAGQLPCFLLVTSELQI